MNVERKTETEYRQSDTLYVARRRKHKKPLGDTYDPKRRFLNFTGHNRVSWGSSDLGKSPSRVFRVTNIC